MKKGFTLIELLAVIVILALIALIATTRIFGTIESARKEAFLSSAHGIISSAQNDCVSSSIYTDSYYKNVIFDNYEIEGGEISYNGNNPQKGFVNVNNECRVEIFIYDDGVCIQKEFYENDLNFFEVSSEEECLDIDFSEEPLIIYEEPTYTKDIIADFNSSVRVGQTIGANKDRDYFRVLTFNEPGYDERGILTFDVSELDMTNVESVELFAYYYYGDIPSRQQTHPVRRMTSAWTLEDELLDSMMSEDYEERMVSLDTSGSGYGWRSADVTDIVSYWKDNPEENFGLVIDHNRGQSNAGGFWNAMRYYSLNSYTEYKPRLRINYSEEQTQKYVLVEPSFDSSPRFDQTIGHNKDRDYLNVLTFNSEGYDTRALLSFDFPISDNYYPSKAKLFAYYYYGDIPSRQQTHPVRRMTQNWNEGDYLTDSMMTDYYRGLMVSLDTSGYGYGWRSADVSYIISHWMDNPEENFGLVIDHNRGESNAGGYWNNMRYYSSNSDTDYKPYIKVYLEER